MDGGRSWDRVRIFGDPKPIRGQVPGTVVFIAHLATYERFEPLHAVSRMDFATRAWTLGAAMGFGALTDERPSPLEHDAALLSSRCADRGPVLR